MARTLIDVVIPVFNGQAYVVEALRSIQAQTVRDIAIHVVDDGSTDCTPALLAAAAAADSRVRVYTRPNGGIVDALNFGLANGAAPLVARHDADDLAYPDRFARQLQTLELRPELVATAGGAKHIGPEGEALGTRTELGDPALNDRYAFPAREPYLLHPFLMVRRRPLMEAGGYRHVVHAEDSDLYWRLIERGPLHNDAELMGEYRLHPDSISSRSIANGRVLSVSSQLAALSAIRRREERADIAFTAERARAIRSGGSSLEHLFALVEGDLTDDERLRLRLAATSKLLEVAGYRPFELERDDCIAFDRAYRAGSELRARGGGATLQRMIAGTAARLLAAGRAEDAWLIGQHNRAGFMTRAAARAIVPQGALRRLRKRL